MNDLGGEKITEIIDSVDSEIRKDPVFIRLMNKFTATSDYKIDWGLNQVFDGSFLICDKSGTPLYHYSRSKRQRHFEQIFSNEVKSAILTNVNNYLSYLKFTESQFTAEKNNKWWGEFSIIANMIMFAIIVVGISCYAYNPLIRKLMPSEDSETVCYEKSSFVLNGGKNYEIFLKRMEKKAIKQIIVLNSGIAFEPGILPQLEMIVFGPNSGCYDLSFLPESVKYISFSSDHANCKFDISVLKHKRQLKAIFLPSVMSNSIKRKTHFVYRKNLAISAPEQTYQTAGETLFEQLTSVSGKEDLEKAGVLLYAIPSFCGVTHLSQMLEHGVMVK